MSILQEHSLLGLHPDTISQMAANNPSEDAPIVKWINQIIMDAIQQNASDIHFEPYENHYRIRYRIDGLLTEIATPPLNIANRAASRIKVMANLDISERRIPQDGHFKMIFSSPHMRPPQPLATGLELSKRSIDLRVNTCPMITGEKIVIRILDPREVQLGVASLGLTTRQQSLFLNAINKPQGMVLVTGPTGSGKTVTLYTALTILNQIHTNISTVEDPVEIKLSGINQVNINPKIGLTFSHSLRALLRQDPDVIMVGEIRDIETAEIAVKAAQTGHLVLSTLHTNSAAETLTRLLSMGIPAFHITHAISLIIAQRLARKLCLHCKQQRHDLPSHSLLKLGFQSHELNTLILYKAQGCAQCNQGYKGRIGLFEVMPMTKTLRQQLLSENQESILQHTAQEGILTLYQAGLEHIRAGHTTIEELNRISMGAD